MHRQLTRWIVLQKARRHTGPKLGSDSLYAHNFRYLFHSPSGVLFTFPSRYLFTIDRKIYLALEGGPPGFPHEETFHVVLRDTSGSRITFAYGAITHYGGPFQAASASEPICNSLRKSQLPLNGPTTPRLQRLRPITQPRFGLLRFRSPLLTECSLFLEVLRCFSSLGVLVTVYIFNRASQGITPGGFPHSDISGSTLARNSPKHFAACHVLRRLLAPRHPPHALSSLTYAFTRLARCWPSQRRGRVGISSTKSMLPFFD